MESERRTARWIGPGLIMAASGIGASDIIASTVAGAGHGLALLWTVAVGAFLKFVLSEGLARWQLATGATALEGWAQHLPRWVLVLFAGYLGLWAVAVSGALTSGCGLAIENLTGGAIPRSWGALAHGALAFAAIFTSRAGGIARVMKPLIVLMFVSIVVCAALTFREPLGALRGLLIPRIPTGGGASVLSLIGGIGGSLTLLSYGYLMREENAGAPSLRTVRLDLGAAYAFTAICGLSVMLIAHRVFHVAGISITDREAVSRMAAELGGVAGPAGFYIYSIGFWAAVTASLFGVWQTVPSICADCLGLLRRLTPDRRAAAMKADGWPYRGSLIFMAAVSVPFAFLGKPLLVIVAFTIFGSLLTPFFAATLLYLNNRVPWSAPIPHNSAVTNIVLILVLILFLLVAGSEIVALLPARGQ